jgi:histidine ammonia-lyase
MLEINGSNLTISDVISVARNNTKVVLDTSARQRIIQSNRWVKEILKDNTPMYGVNTGFGLFSDRRIPPEASKALNRHLILSHSVGTGLPLPVEVVRAAMLIRANTLAIGLSGVRPVIVERLIDMLNKQVIPIVPSQGSLGSSGDLAPLSHMALVLTTDENDLEEESGWAFYRGKQMSGKAAMQAANLERLVLEPKEGLALNNGATFSAALAVLAISDSEYLLDVADIALSMSLEAMLGVSNAFDPRLHAARHHPGQIQVATHVRELNEGSTLIDAANRIQDAYSLRCAPQVQGASRDTLKFVREVIQREINAVTDNPLLFAANDVISGGNFHGEPVGFASDFLSIAMAEIGAISERRIFRLTDARLNSGLPSMLVDSPEAAGINSGMMMPQYTAASLVLENQSLAGPDSIHSLPTSGEQEDHNANAMTAARHAYSIVKNTSHVLAIEIYCAARALDLRLKKMPEAKMGHGVKHAYQKVREKVPYQAGDALWGPEIDQVEEVIWNKDFLPEEILSMK